MPAFARETCLQSNTPEPPSSPAFFPSVAAQRPPARVLHVVEGLGSPSETFIADRMLELERLGWQAWVAAQWVHEAAVVAFPPRQRLEVARRWQLRAQTARALLQPWRSDGHCPSRWLGRTIAAVRPAVIHAHFGWVARDALPVARRRGIPLVAGLHGYDVTIYPRYGHGVLDRPTAPPRDPEEVYAELFNEAGSILVVSRFLERRLRELGYEREVRVVPSGIRLECFPYRGPRHRPEHYRLLFVGRLVPYKGLNVLLRALAEVVRRVENARLYVVGDGPTREANEHLTRRLGIADRVVFRGAQPRSGVLRALRDSDVLVAPSTTTPAGQAEGLGNVVKEALAVGLPVAASDSGGLPEVTPPAYRRELVPEDDHLALADRLVGLWRRRGEWPERTARGRRWVEEAFDWRKLAPRIGEAYQEAIEKSRTGPLQRD
jgi:colanic acid/amylovoran biosynthesis glycosyltransferase